MLINTRKGIEGQKNHLPRAVAGRVGGVVGGIVQGSQDCANGRHGTRRAKSTTLKHRAHHVLGIVEGGIRDEPAVWILAVLLARADLPATWTGRLVKWAAVTADSS